MRKLLLISILLPLLTACSITSSNNTDKFLESVPYPNSTEILDKQQKDDYEIVFYKDETGFRIGYKKLVMSIGQILPTVR